MPKITYIEHTGAEYVVDVAVGDSVMEGAINHDIDGIQAECGGALACATCHVYVDTAWLDKFGSPEEEELDMLECAASERKENSRLSCQLAVADAHDGLVIQLPESQY